MRPLMHGIDRYEHRGIADRKCCHAAHRRLGMAVMVDVGIVEHDLPPSARQAGTISFAFHEAIDDTALEIFRTRSLRQLYSGVTDRVIDAVDIERVFHHGMADA